jgi:iron(II)-dependent oxidoreductase
MTGDANHRAFYCPVHRVRFHANGDAAIQCEQSSHAIGFGFPDQSAWTYCCDCATFWPTESSSHSSQTDCLVCERQIARRYLCNICQVVSIESTALVRRKAHSIDDTGVRPVCPGCGSAPAESSLEHHCPELGVSFLTARSSCLFCGLELNAAEIRHEPVCIDCGAELIAPYRFCRRCGKAQSEPEPATLRDDTEAYEFNEELDDTDPGEASAVSSVSSWDYSPPAAPVRSRTPWLIGGIAGLLSVILLAAVILINTNKNARDSGQTGPVVSEAPPSAPPGMVYIAGGEFTMGTDTGDEYERPAHKVAVAPFFIDITEVTCEAYLKFILATGHRRPRGWANGTYPSGAAKRPVTGIDWNDAMAYAGWARNRLPTEEEWEFVARNAVGAVYPWGNDWRPNFANAGNSSAHKLVDVGSYPNGKTPAGVMDLIGNAWEWTSSDVRVYPGGHLTSPAPKDVKIIRGGSWQETEKQATTTYRGFLRMTGADDYSATGFRCVKDVEPAPRPTTDPRVR